MFGFFRRRPRFTFLDPGRLTDGELELIAPTGRLIADVLTAVRHPMTIADAPAMARVDSGRLKEFLRNAPDGRQQPDPSAGLPPAYHFWMRVSSGPVGIGGGISLRITDDPETVRIVGHMGYHVYPPLRGRHFAERACRLLLPLAARHGIDPVWITCNPDNLPSRRTCERLGGRLIDIVDVPPDNPMYHHGDRQKCRYQIQNPMTKSQNPIKTQ